MAGSVKRETHAPKPPTPGLIEPPATEPALDRAIQARIGDKLRAMYGELAEQPVPDRLTAILAQLGRQADQET
mgnify:CR=1 FL=1